jgi:hypothetical protein
MTEQRPASTFPAAPVQREKQPQLIVDAGPGRLGGFAISVQALGPDHMRLIADHVQAGRQLEPVLRVTVMQPEGFIGNIPAMLGTHEILADGLRFIPSFPFEPGVQYRAVFDGAAFLQFTRTATLTLDFKLPHDGQVGVTEVTRVHPSGNTLPENLLRFYVGFSNAMQRGRAETEIRLLGPDGETVVDALYRAPVELWDPTMRVLTVLLDPGRLKRGVGPNRELGPPIQVGQTYTLEIGAGMTDRFGRAVEAPVLKRFTVTDPVRQRVMTENWVLLPPPAATRKPLSVRFPKSLDWAMLFEAITVVAASGDTVGGRITVDQCETRWRFTPDEDWAAGCYQLRVTSVLEDPCGNNLSAAFDQPLRAGPAPREVSEWRSIPFALSAGE